jgi:hypothetical protein
VQLRHRLWISVSEPAGQVDLIAKHVDNDERQRFKAHSVANAHFAPYSSNSGVQLSLKVPEVRQTKEFSAGDFQLAFQAMEDLAIWYIREFC